MLTLRSECLVITLSEEEFSIQAVVRLYILNTVICVLKLIDIADRLKLYGFVLQFSMR